MTIAQIRYFLEVCRLESVTKAAQAMHLSQPSVSAAIRELEDEFGVNLFHRIKKRLVLTQEGTYFWEKAALLVEQLDSLAEQMRDFGLNHNQIRMGVPPMIGTLLFPSLFHSFHEAYPDIEIIMAEHGSLKVRELVQNDELDVAIAILDTDKSQEFDKVHLFKTALLFCVAPSHPMAERKAIRLEDLHGEPIILLSDGSYQNRELMQTFADKQISPKVQLTSSQLYTIKKMLHNGKVGAFLFEELVATEPDLVGIQLVEPIHLDICLIWKKGRHILSDTTKLIEFVKEVIA